MKIIFKLFLVPAFWLFSPLSFGQVPASEDAQSPVPTAPVGDLSEMEDLPFSALSDPLELSLLEGLDDPLERLRLRDQDTNMILDLIQVITGRYILRPALPAVKITLTVVMFSKRNLTGFESHWR